MQDQNQQQVFTDWMAVQVARVEKVLDEFLPQEQVQPQALHAAIRWATLGAGKRVRAAMTFAAAHACHPSVDPTHEHALNRAAAAVELIHAYSLIHDDLPCMDDDDVRRGKPATHVQYGEAIALLAGDAMQPLAFEWLSEMPISPALVLQAVRALSLAIGSQGMAGGQAIDLLSTGLHLSRDELMQMHAKKTGSLLAASVQLGAIVVGAGSAQRENLRHYSQAIGLAFQVIDDVLDATQSSNVLGKTAGKDLQCEKATYVTLLGVDEAKKFADQLHKQACDALLTFGKRGHYLQGLADLVVHRAF
jgi:farnesyl diphosphate synthase